MKKIVSIVFLSVAITAASASAFAYDGRPSSPAPAPGRPQPAEPTRPSEDQTPAPVDSGPRLPRK